MLYLTWMSWVVISSGNAAAQAPQEKPNIIYIMADDLGYGDVGFNGQKKIKTPHLDRMAEQGMVLTHHYAGSTVCGPSRASLLTGFHTGHSAVRQNPGRTKSGIPVDLSDSDVTVAEELKKAGYTTGIIGKWGLAENLDEGQPNQQGFDFFYGFNRHRQAHHYYPDSIWQNEEYIPLAGNVTVDKKGKYIHELFTEQALGFIDQNKAKPFFLYLAYTIPHYELTVPNRDKKAYQNKNWPVLKMTSDHYYHDENGHVTYAAMVSKMDNDIGDILNCLKESGLDENTLVIFTSDNGHEYDDTHDEFFNSNGPFKGKKRDLYEGGIRVPFVARWPGKIQAGTKRNHVSAFWDFLPTACSIAGIEPSITSDGISYLPTLLSEGLQEKHDYLYWEFNERQGPMQAIIKDKWKLIHYISLDKQELYNLKCDPFETQDLSTNESDTTVALLQLMNEVRTEHPEFPLDVLTRQRKKVKFAEK